MMQVGRPALRPLDTKRYIMNYVLLSIAGPDRVSFLQGQMTQDLDRLPAEVSLPSAWCSPKGRVLLTCRLLGLEDRVVMAVPSASADIAMQRLGMYRLRAKVDISQEHEQRFLAFAGAPARQLAAGLGAQEDGGVWRAAGICGIPVPGPAQHVEVFATPGALADVGLSAGLALDAAAWAGARIAAGLVDIDSGNSERFTPHMLNLDLVGAISFNKGCYTGQEIVARTEHLGKVKRRVFRYGLAGATVAPGDKLQYEGADLGEVVNVARDELLAVVPVDRSDETLNSKAGNAEPLPLPYRIG